MRIPIARPSLGRPEARAASRAILSGWVTQGPEVGRFEASFAGMVGARHACAVSSCTTALHLALLSIGVKPGDIVVTVSHSFIATANSVRYCMAEPVFVDIDPGTFNMDPAALERFLDSECIRSGDRLFYRDAAKLAAGESPLRALSGKLGRIAAIMPVHQMGMPADIGSILKIARRYRLPVVEDAACAIGSEIRLGNKWDKVGRPHGDVACFSFHPRKVITTGDGGMLSTTDSGHDRLFRLLRQHGMSVSDRARHLSAKISAESYLLTAYNYRMTDIQAAVGSAQLGRLRDIVAARRRVAAAYREELSGVKWLKLPEEPAYCRSNYQSFPVKLLGGSRINRDGLMQRLLDMGISTRRGIMNAHQEPPYRNHKYRLPASEAARDNTILLPIYEALKDADIRRIGKAIKYAG